MEHRDIYNKMLEKINYYEIFVNCIEKCENFTYVRYNDGELDLIFKKNPGFSHILKIWGTEIEKESSKLRNILSKELEYYIGLCPGYTKNNVDLLESIINSNVRIIPTNLFSIDDIQTLKHLIEVLSKRNTIVVGPDYLRKLELHKVHIITPMEYVWNHVESIIKELEISIKELENPVILYSCSLAKNIISDFIFDKYKYQLTQIDIGSSFDPFCGVYSRTNHDEIMKKNDIEIVRNIKKEIYQKKRI
jgi:hypothetical protein